MGVLEPAERPQLLSHVVVEARPQLRVLQDATPDLTQLCVFLPAIHAVWQQVQALVLLADQAAQTLFHPVLILLLCLLVHSLDVAIRQSVLLHQVD